MSVKQGATTSLWAYFRDTNGDLIDPTSPKVNILNESGVEVVSSDDPVNDAVGVYYYSYDVPEDAIPGDWTIQWSGVVGGVPVAEDETFEVVFSDYIAPPGGNFTTKARLESFWRTLTSAEDERATLLLTLASDRLRSMGEDLEVDLDAKVTASNAFRSTIEWVVLEAVKRALQTPTDTLPVDTFAQTAGPYSENYKYSNPSGDLWFKKSELSALGLYGKQTLGSIDPITDGKIYS
jgi:hypothetical protein